MTAESDVAAAIDRYVRAWEAGDLAAIIACYHDEFILHYFGQNALSGDHVGKSAALKTLAEFGKRTHRKLIRIVSTMAGETRGAIIARERLRLGPDAVEVERLLVYAVRDDLLAECWIYDQDQALIDCLVGA